MTLFNADTSAFGTILNNSGGSDTYVITYTSAGVVQWVARVSGVNTEEAYGICSTTDGGICVTGYYVSASNPLTAFNANSPNASGFATTLTGTVGNDDIFIVKYNSAGTVQWITRVGSTGNDYGYGICGTTDNGICVTGFYSGTLTAFNASSPNSAGFATTLSNAGSNDVFIVKYTSAGAVQWITRVGGAGDDQGRAICSTPDGGICILGTFTSSTLTAFNSNNTTFATTLSNSGTSGSDYFIAKYNSFGFCIWIAEIGGSDNDTGNVGIATTSDGHIVATGNYQSSPLTMYNGDGTAFLTTLPLTGTQAAFVAEYAAVEINSNVAPPTGNVQWVARVGGSGNEQGNGICSMSDGGICVTGYYASATLTAFNANASGFATILTVNAGSNDTFIVKYNSAGSVQWITRVGGAWDDKGQAICSTTDGGVCVTGYYGSTSNPLTAFHASSPNASGFATTLSNMGNEETYIVKYSSAGIVQWITRLGNTGNTQGQGICSTLDGGMCVTGWYDTLITAYNANNPNATTGWLTTLNNPAGYDTYIVKYNSLGAVQWITRLGGNASEVSNAICGTTDGGICVTGYYGGTPTAFNANAPNATTGWLTTLTNAGNDDIFIVKYTSAGAVQWITRIGGALDDKGNAICSTPDGGICVTGRYGSTTLTAFNASSPNASGFATTLPVAGSSDTFIVKYTSAGAVQWITRVSGAGDDGGLGICSTTDGGICVTGYIGATVTTAYNANNPGATTGWLTTLPGSGIDYDVFIVKYSSAGFVMWVARIGAGGAAYEQGNAICSTPDGGICVTGYMGTGSTFITAFNSDNTAFGTTMSRSGVNDVLIVKYY
jgi:cold shock CspA family protein